MPNIYKINVSPKPLTNLTAVLTFTDDSTSTRTDWIEADTYYTITETTVKTLKSLTISANNYITQTLETSDWDIDITLSPDVKYVSKIKNNGVVYTLKDESVDGKIEGLANKTLSNVSSIDNNSAVATALNGKQATLVSGTNIKTINNTSLLGSGNIDTNNIFIAEYGVTSYSDIDTAYNAGKMLFVVEGDFYYPLMSVDSSGYVFSSPDSDGIYQVYISSDGTWSGNEYGFPTKISDLTDDTSTYPISKADALTGLTATISELNILDGATLSTTELNYVDGVTSSIQTQLNNKQDTLVSGTNIKTVNNTSLLGSGNLSVGTVTSVNNTAPVNGDVTISIPTVNNATLTIQKNGTTVNTFTANSSSDVTANITVPTAVTDLSDASNYVTNTGLSTILDDYATEQWAQQQASSLYTSIQGWVNNQGYAVSANLADVATTGDYDDLLNKPAIPQAQIQSDWNQTDSSAVDFIKNKPTIPSGVIVDQVYDGTSTNAQSGVAIAGELTNYLQASNGNVTFTNGGTVGGITYEDSGTGEMYGTFIGYTPFGHGVMMGAVDPNGYLLGVTSSGINIFKGTTVHPTNSIALTVTNNNTLAINGTEVALSTDIPTNISDLTDDTATYPIDKAESVVDNNSGNLKFWSGTQEEYNNYEINTDILTTYGTPTFNIKTGIASEFTTNKYFRVIATSGDTIYLKIKATDIQTKQGIFGNDVSIGIYNGYLGYNTQSGGGVFTNVAEITANQYIYLKIYVTGTFGDSNYFCSAYYNFDGSSNYNTIIAGSSNLFNNLTLGKGYIEGSGYTFNGEIDLSESYLVSNNQTEYFANNTHENNIVCITTDTNRIYKGDILLSDDNSKQNTLVSGTNIKTVNSTSLLGSGDISVGTVKSVNNTSPDSNGNVSLTIPTVPTNISAFTNDSGYIASSALTDYVTTNTDQNITGTKTYVGQKKIGFKQSSSSDKLGFTLYNNSNVEKGYLEYNPSNTVDSVPLMTLGNYASASGGLTHVGFRKYSSISGASGAYNLLAPLISDARTPFNLTTTYTNFYLPLGFTDGTTTVTTAKSGLCDLSSILPDISTKQDTLVSGTNIKTINNTNILGSGNIDIDTIYWATYGTTTFSQIQTAVNNGNTVILDYNGKYLPLVFLDTDVLQKGIFSAVYDCTEYSATIIFPSSWSNNSFAIAKTSDIPTYNFHGDPFYSTDGDTTGIPRDCNSLTANGHYYYTSSGPSGLGEQATDGAIFVQGYNDNWVTQIAQDYRTGNLFVRSKNEGTWVSWKAIANKSDIPDISTKQDTLVSGTNIKTINNTSILGSGNIDTSEIFIAEYNTVTPSNSTSFSDIKTAYEAGKRVYCNVVGANINADIKILPLVWVGYQLGEITEFSFGNIHYTQTNFLMINNLNSWTYGTNTLADNNLSNVSSISSSSAVKTALDTKVNTSDIWYDSTTSTLYIGVAP